MKFLADENFNNDIVSGMRRRLPTIDLTTIQEVGLSGMSDPEVLAGAAEQGRIVLTHDVQTMTRFAYERISAGDALPGVFEILRTVPVRLAIDELFLIATCSLEGEWVGQVRYIPLR